MTSLTEKSVLELILFYRAIGSKDIWGYFIALFFWHKSIFSVKKDILKRVCFHGWIAFEFENIN